MEYGHRRWHIDRFYEDAKNELGLGDYQGRKWTGFHRHIIILLLVPVVIPGIPSLQGGIEDGNLYKRFIDKLLMVYGRWP